MNIEQENIFKTIEKHLYEEYGIYFAKPESNWYKDLELNNIQKQDFFKWVENKFNVQLPYFYFLNLKTLCELISTEQIKKAVQTQKTNFMQRIKQIFVRRK